jgi:hypothetical protein
MTESRSVRGSAALLKQPSKCTSLERMPSEIPHDAATEPWTRSLATLARVAGSAARAAMELLHAYGGYPAALNALTAAKEVFDAAAR